MISQILITVLTFAASAVALWISARLGRDARKSRNWPALPGKIVERGTESLQSDGRSFTPVVKYSYSVAGTEYVGQQVYRTGRAGRAEGSAKRLVDRLPDAIPVHYNPQDPGEAYLLADPAWIFWIAMVFGVAAFVWGLLQVLTITMA